MYLTTLLDIAYKECPDKNAVYHGERSLTYKELYNLSGKLANALKGMGVNRGDRIGLYLSSRLEFYICYWAIVRSGAIAVLLNSMLKKNEIEYILSDTQAQIAFSEKSIANELIKACDALPESREIIIVDDDSIAGSKSLGSIVSQNESLFAQPDIDRNDIVSIIYTSGTTGKPKGATQTHKSIWSNVASFVATNKIFDSDVFLCCLPIFNNFGLNVVSMGAVYSGCSVILHERFDAQTILNDIKKHKATYLAGTPTMYSYLLNEYDSGIHDVSSLRVCNSGGAFLATEILNKVEETFNCTMLNGYGQTEGCGFTTLNPLVGVRKLGSVGLPLSNLLFRILDPKGNEMPANEVGEIALKGDTIASTGYWNKPEANENSFSDGWFLSGDLGYKDEDGYIYVVDRKTDLIITGGSNIYPAEVEEALYKHPKISLAAVIGVPDEVKGEIPKAYVVLKEGERCSEKEIVSYCRENMAVYKAPRIVEFVDDLPKGVTGKILKRILKEKTASE